MTKEADNSNHRLRAQKGPRGLRSGKAFWTKSLKSLAGEVREARTHSYPGLRPASRSILQDVLILSNIQI